MLLVLAGILVAAAAIVLARDDGDEVTKEPPQLLESADTAPPPTIAPSPASTVSPTEVPPPEEPVPLPDRANCAEIRGTPYRSDAERALFLANCLAPVQTASTSAPIVVADISPNCTTNVQIRTNRSNKTFAVGGMTLAEINESLLATGPVVGGVTASGVTEYGYGITGSTCTAPGSCSIGAMAISADIVITLPILTTLNQVSPEIKAIWERFAERIKVHENRHATIVEEGLAEIKRLLLAVAQQPNCDTLDHEIDKVWVYYGIQMEQRQEAFHIADRSGLGGLVVR